MRQPNAAQKRKVKNFKNNEHEVYEQVLQEQGQPESFKDYSSFIMALWLASGKQDAEPKTINPTKRIYQLNDRAESLMDQAEPIVKPYKLDRHSFPYENLWERYRSKSKRLRRIQRLVRDCDIEARQRVAEILNNKKRS